MSDLVAKARTAKRENRQIEFKSDFDPKSGGQWCEIIKDVVAISNSGGGVIVFGVADDGRLSENMCADVSQIDHADLANKFQKYTGCSDPPVEIIDLDREGQRLTAFLIQASQTPMVFVKPGTYDAGGNEQKVAFRQGTVYFRHGAKSEPGTGDDLRIAFERRLDALRQNLLRNVKKVVKAPAGAEIIIGSKTSDAGRSRTGMVRAVNDPSATPIVLTRDSETATGIFLHESVSEGIFDEINNVVDANRILAKARQRFFFGSDIYYRIYAERRYVKQERGEFLLLFRAGAGEFYAPCLYWALHLDDESIGKVLADVYLAPRGNQIHWFMRTTALLGTPFCNWVSERWEQKWGKHSQPPNFFFSFKQVCADLKHNEPRLVAAKVPAAEKFGITNGQEFTAL